MCFPQSQRRPGPVRPGMLLDAATDLLDPVRVRHELRGAGNDRRRVPVGQREQLQRLAYGAVPARPPSALSSLLGPPIRLLYPLQKRRLPRDAHGLGPSRDLPRCPAAFFEVAGEGEPGLEDGVSQLLELGLLRVAQREPDAPPPQRRGETRL